MAEFLKPDNLNIVWASGGDRLYPGDTKYASGWGVEIPPRQYFNEIDYKQDQMLAHLNQRGIVEWDVDTEYQAGKSYIQSESGTIYRCTLTHSGQNPDLDVTGTYWEIAFLNSYQGVEVATPEQAREMVSDQVFISPLQLANAFTGITQILEPQGTQEFPGGLILKWGSKAVPQGSGGTVYDFIGSFNEPPFVVMASHLGSSLGVINAEAAPIGLNQVRLTHNHSAVAQIAYFAIGK